MRFSLIAAVAAAAFAVPLVMAASGPQMSSEEFLTAVRCTAYAEVSQPGADHGAARWRLNAEALHQAPDTVVAAEAEVGAIARAAVADAPGADRLPARACAHAVIAGGNGRTAG